MLEIKNLVAGYGSARVLHGVDLRVDAGEMVAMVGANGAGKSTLLKTISGLVHAVAGSIHIDGAPIDDLTPVARVRLGIAHVPEGRQIFGELSVADNLRLGAYTQQRSLTRSDIEARIAEVTAIFPVLGERMHLSGASLSGGQQQMLAIGRGLMLRPRLLLLDEPSLGLAPLLVTEIFRILAGLRQSGVAILLSEQNARLSLAIADRGYVLENGTIALCGSGRELLEAPEIKERYLGVAAGAAEAGAATRRGILGTNLRAILSFDCASVARSAQADTR